MELKSPFVSFAHAISLSLPLPILQVNGQNVVKVGHRQVVNTIRQGGNSLTVKVVMVARNPEMEEVPKKKGQCSSRGHAKPRGLICVPVMFILGFTLDMGLSHS